MAVGYRDTTKAKRLANQVLDRAIMDHRMGDITDLREMAAILHDMDARTGTRDPSVKKKAKAKPSGR